MICVCARWDLRVRQRCSCLFRFPLKPLRVLFLTIVRLLAQDFMQDYVFLTVGRVGASTELITQRVEFASQHDKQNVLMKILPECDGLTLVFVQTKRSADQLQVKSSNGSVIMCEVEDTLEQVCDFSWKQIKPETSSNSQRHDL